MLDLTLNLFNYEDFMATQDYNKYRQIELSIALHTAIWFQLARYSAARFLSNNLFFNRAITQLFISYAMTYFSQPLANTFINTGGRKEKTIEYSAEVLLPAIAAIYAVYHFALKNSKFLSNYGALSQLPLLLTSSISLYAFYIIDSRIKFNTRERISDDKNAVEPYILCLYDSARSFAQTFCAIALYAKFKGFELSTQTILKYSSVILAAKLAIDLYNMNGSKNSKRAHMISEPNFFSTTKFVKGSAKFALDFVAPDSKEPSPAMSN